MECSEFDLYFLIFITFLKNLFVVLFPLLTLTSNLLVFLFHHFFLFLDAKKWQFDGFKFVIIWTNSFFKLIDLSAHISYFMIFQISFFFESSGLHFQFLQNLLSFLNLSFIMFNFLFPHVSVSYSFLILSIWLLFVLKTDFKSLDLWFLEFDSFLKIVYLDWFVIDLFDEKIFVFVFFINSLWYFRVDRIHFFIFWWVRLSVILKLVIFFDNLLL